MCDIKAIAEAAAKRVAEETGAWDLLQELTQEAALGALVYQSTGEHECAKRAVSARWAARHYVETGKSWAVGDGATERAQRSREAIREDAASDWLDPAEDLTPDIEDAIDMRARGAWLSANLRVLTEQERAVVSGLLAGETCREMAVRIGVCHQRIAVVAQTAVRKLSNVA